MSIEPEKDDHSTGQVDMNTREGGGVGDVPASELRRRGAMQRERTGAQS